MNNERFASAYNRLPEKKVPSNPERREVLEAPRKWMRFFDATMANYLSGEPAPHPETFMDTVTEYYSWRWSSLAPLASRARDLDDPAIENDISSEFTFHHINGPLAFTWYQLLYEQTERCDPKTITDIQVELAVTMTPSVKRLKQLQHSEIASTDFKDYKMLKGAVSELDATITLLELVKKEPHLIVLPAPESFERNPHSTHLNADILVINTLHKQVHGVQVKTNTVEGTGGRKKYDTEYVTVIDSAHELGNTTYNKQDKIHRISLPGQIAMGLLSERPIKDVPPGVVPRDFLRSRQIAKELSRGKKSFLPQATRHLANRILPKLEKSDQP